MNRLEISYDPAKRAWTLEHRALDFEHAVRVFAGPVADVLDDRQDYGEIRSVTYGLLDNRLVAVVWTARGEGRHIISMRNAMNVNEKNSNRDWLGPDDAPELTEEIFRRAQISIGGKVIREATGTLTKAGRPPIGGEPKQQVTLRLSRDVLGHFKAGGPGWQTRISEALERAVRKDSRRSA